MTPKFSIRPATSDDIPLVLRFIKDLAEYEKLPHEVTATEELLRRNLFAERKTAEVLLASEGEEYVGFAVFFHNFSTFVGQPGIYLEDVFVRPEF
ncbi:MAG: GNAT family N-acetyltransferase, partial [Verrucomicrobiota bacterium]